MAGRDPPPSARPCMGPLGFVLTVAGTPNFVVSTLPAANASLVVTVPCNGRTAAAATTPVTSGPLPPSAAAGHLPLSSDPNRADFIVSALDIPPGAHTSNSDAYPAPPSLPSTWLRYGPPVAPKNSNLEIFLNSL